MISIGELTIDPDFCNPSGFEVYRRLNGRGANGRTKKQEIKIVPNPIGSIQPGANPDVIRETDLQYNEDLITIITAFRLQSNTKRGLPDIVVWRGSRYVVKLVNDWTEWGSHVSAICALEESAEDGEEEFVP